MSNYQPSGISLVIPMYNERENIARTLRVIDNLFSRMPLDYEIIVCNDGSNDGSEKIVEQIAKNNHRIQLINLARNLGYGCALRVGFWHAKKDLVMYTDSDLPCDLSVLRDSLGLFGEVDMLIGFRNRRDNLLRQIYSITYNALIRKVFNIKVKDINYSFKVFKKTLLDHLALKSKGSFIDAEIVAKAIKSGYHFKEIGVKYVPRQYGKSRLSSPKVIIFIIYEMIKLYPEITRMRKNTPIS